MSAAAVATEAPAQASLEGIAPARECRPMLYIVGPLLHRPELRVAANGDCTVELVIEQHWQGHPHAAPFFAQLHVPARGAPHVAYQVAHAKTAFRVGDHVLLRGQGLEPGQHRGAPVLRLIHCDGIVPAADFHPRPTGGSDAD